MLPIAHLTLYLIPIIPFSLRTTTGPRRSQTDRATTYRRPTERPSSQTDNPDNDNTNHAAEHTKHTSEPDTTQTTARTRQLTHAARASENREGERCLVGLRLRFLLFPLVSHWGTRVGQQSARAREGRPCGSHGYGNGFLTTHTPTIPRVSILCAICDALRPD